MGSSVALISYSRETLMGWNCMSCPSRRLRSPVPYPDRMVILSAFKNPPAKDELIFSRKNNDKKIIVNLIEIRNELREAEQWQQADMIRDKLSEAGTALVDTPQGTVWKRKR